jgi:hypothetical protein
LVVDSAELCIVRGARRSCQNARGVVVPIGCDVQPNGPTADQEDSDDKRYEKDVPARVGGHRGHVAHIAVQVGIPGGVAERILCRPAAGGRVEVAGAVVVQPVSKSNSRLVKRM